MKNSSWIWSLVVIVLVAITSYGLFVLTRGTPLPEGFVYGNGHIEGRDVKLAAEHGGRVVRHNLVEGESVSAGDTLVEIAPEDADEQIRAAQADLETLKDKIAAVNSERNTWSHHAETSKRQLERVRALAAKKLAAPQDLDAAENAVKAAQGRLQMLQDQRGALEAQQQAAEARLALARSQRDKLKVTAPLSGTVLIRAVETGEVVAAGQPLAVIVDLSRLELKVYVSAADLNHLHLADEAAVRVDDLSRIFIGRVSRIDDFAQFTPRDVHMPDERQRMVYGVTLAVENPEGLLKPGMPADAWVRWDAAKPWPDPLTVPSD